MKTTQEAADILKVSRALIIRLCAQNRIKGAKKFGREWMIPDAIKVLASKNPRPSKINYS